jgi:beta-lactamase superfamily II metal-dependent hydrolase
MAKKKKEATVKVKIPGSRKKVKMPWWVFLILVLIVGLVVGGVFIYRYVQSQKEQSNSSSSEATTGVTVPTSTGTTSGGDTGEYLYTKKPGDKLTVYAIEQTGMYGDCTLFKYGDFEMLIDGGNSSSSAQLQDFVTKYVTDHVLDVVVLTHPHEDHFGGFMSSSNYSTGGTLAAGGVTSVRYIVDNGVQNGTNEPKYWDNGVRAYYVNKGAKYQTAASLVNGHMYDAIWKVTSDLTIQWLDTDCYSYTGSDYNRASVVCSVRAGTYDYIMTGDATVDAINGILKNYPAATHPFIKDGDTVVFKACHHFSGASDSGNTTAFMNYLKPTWGWCSSGILSGNGADKINTPATAQHPYKNGAVSITALTTKDHFFWNGTAGTLDMTLDESFQNFAIVGEGRKYGYGYNISGTLVGVDSEKTKPLYSTQWVGTAAFADGTGGVL